VRTVDDGAPPLLPGPDRRPWQRALGVGAHYEGAVPAGD
jgi:hypothetical protein